MIRLHKLPAILRLTDRRTVVAVAITALSLITASSMIYFKATGTHLPAETEKTNTPITSEVGSAGTDKPRSGEPPPAPTTTPPAPAATPKATATTPGAAASTPSPTPAPTPSSPTSAGIYFGANPANPGGASLAAATTVVSKWGNTAAIRQFNGSDLTSGPHHPSGASIVHTSYKPNVASVNSGALDAQITALVQRTAAGDVLEFYHEPDNDGLSAQGITDMINAKNRLYDIKQSVKPSVLVAATMTGGFFASYTAESTRQPWYGLRGDLVGLDADGVHDSTGPTYDTSYSDEVAGVKTFMTRNPSANWVGWGVPEHGTSRQPWDTTGTPRANWFTAQTNIFITNGARYVMLYDYNTSGHDTATNYNQIVANTPEYTVWRNLVAGNPH